ncbi:N-succinyl-L,L-diaminopimelate aminotransferase alternative [invertebrate metagenome]|uniref:N-succinyl-L,L-diaminopimelate aminotransferase alternative n=1 Tax=invertebrate metagenome TaxID=1711999 RepID=A0A484H5W9_9ZZZZ
MIYNERFVMLTDYPFERLRGLLKGITPPPGRHIIMSVGEPQHPPPSFVRDILDVNSDLWSRYPPMNGTPAFRSAATDWLVRRFNLPTGLLDPDRHVLPVAGTREALYLIAHLVIPRRKSGERTAVLIPNPFYQVYVGAAVMARAEPIYVTASWHTNFLPDFHTLNPAVLRRTTAASDPSLLNRTALAFLCTPANPQGAVANLDYLKQTISMARHYNFVLAVDECYSEIYDGSPPSSALQACAELGGDLTNVVVFHSLSKRSSVPGLRSGFIAGDPDIIASFARLRAYGGAAVPLPIIAAATALWQDERHVVENRARYRAKMDIAAGILGHRFGFRRPPGTFFLWLRVGDGEAAARLLFREAGIQVLPGAYLARPDKFGVNPGRNYIRVALVHDIELIAWALECLCNVLDP